MDENLSMINNRVTRSMQTVSGSLDAEHSQTRQIWYLASPYSRYPYGPDRAFEDAAREAALLLNAGILTYCPVVAAHPLARYLTDRNPLDYQHWEDLNLAFMDRSCGCIVLKLEGWEMSSGIDAEVTYYSNRADHPPIIYMTPGEIPADLASVSIPSSDDHNHVEGT